MIKNNVPDSLATEVNSCIQIFIAEGEGGDLQKVGHSSEPSSENFQHCEKICYAST